MRSKYIRWYRRMRTTAERRANCDPDHIPYVRGKRRGCNLPDPWDDRGTTVTNNWKDYRRTQYRPNGRGEQHRLVLDSRRQYGVVWELEEYFKDHDIPHRVTRRYRRETHVTHGHWVGGIDYSAKPTKHVWRTTKPRLKNGPNKQEVEYVEHVSYSYPWNPRLKWIQYDRPRISYTQHRLGYEIVWWSNKDIGIEYILKRIKYL